MGYLFMKNKSFLIGLLLLCIVPFRHAYAFDAGQIREIVNLTDYLAQFSPVVRPVDVFNQWEKSAVRTVDGASLSPDGAQVAWHGEIRERVTNLPATALCTHTFSKLETYCYLLPDVAKSLSALNWSHDGNYVFFTNERIESTQNSDLWVFSTTRGLLLNATNSNALVSNVIPNNASIAPTWDSFNNNLYFIRDLTQAGGATSWELHRITSEQLETAFQRLSQDLLIQAGQVQGEIDSALDSAEETRAIRQSERAAYEGLILPSDRQVPSPEDYVINFTTVNALQVSQPTIQPTLVAPIGGLPEGSSLNDTYRETLFAPTQLDQGGLMMALLLNNATDPTQAGLWLLDLTSVTLMPFVLVENIRTVEPSWVQTITLTDLQWTPDNTGILFTAFLEGQTVSYHNIYHQSLLTMTLDPVVKLAFTQNENDFFNGDLSTQLIDSAFLLPSGELVYFNRSMRNRLYSVPVPPVTHGAEAEITELSVNLSQQRRMPSSVGIDNHAVRVIVDFNLLTLQR
jgi:hypothetical protein